MTREEQDRQFQIECLTHELVEMLMDKRDMTMEQAMDAVYRSHTFEKIENARTGLFYQSAVYVMDMLSEELDQQMQNAEKQPQLSIMQPIA